MLVVKFGGSAITDKKRPYTYRWGRLRAAAQALRGTRAILIHGAGSFAHPHVKAFGLTPAGVAKTKAALRRQTAMVVEDLAAASIYAMPIEPSEVFWGAKLVRREPIDAALSAGLYPLLHGDVVPSDGGYVVVSGDDMAVELASAYRPRAVVFLMDVDGIYTAEPGTPGAVKLREIAGGVAGGAAGIDVTGGIAKKVEAGLAIAGLGIPAYYCSIDDVAAVADLAAGREPETCSVARPSK
ncbi:aspartate/glutamate/uridylate kinase [Thermoproteus uzoniensis 768-20]|uniref:Isopentenyl phosphate kinase n=1 Tax=Thermoproteus uzoniensis (strain 768-20) TaxID=999630 RepID=F2L1Q4_THEU7|nr:isopentenyl phosphate kinase [Thermoproteus uzoniensis]AEA12910.1 aspartate/glutamate/uridylate kinase [Thermoproteus uzoniensis 768-20]